MLATDHGGFHIKEELKTWLQQCDPTWQIKDGGAFVFDPEDDYPLFGTTVAQEVSEANQSFEADPTTIGILLCRTGGGMTIVANRFRNIRAVTCRSVADVVIARQHNNANILVLEGDHVPLEEAKQMIQTFFVTKFEGGRHARRLGQIAKIQN